MRFPHGIQTENSPVFKQCCVGGMGRVILGNSETKKYDSSNTTMRKCFGRSTSWTQNVFVWGALWKKDICRHKTQKEKSTLAFIILRGFYNSGQLLLHQVCEVKIKGNTVFLSQNNPGMCTYLANTIYFAKLLCSKSWDWFNLTF